MVYGTKLLGDVVVAVTVTALAAPFLAVIDKALVERTTAAAAAASATTLPTNHHRHITVWTSMIQTSVTILQQPGKFFKSPTFFWMWGTYAATYTAANTLRTMLTSWETSNHNSSTTQKADAPQTTTTTVPTNHSHHHHQYSQYYLPSAGTTVLMGTSIVNSTASVLKDRAYAQLYGVTTSSTTTSTGRLVRPTVPPVTYALWVFRDLTVIGAAFVLPHHVAQFWMQQQQYSQNHQSHHTQFSETTIRRISQIVTPVVAQIIAGPLHFVGYDCYNHHNTTLHHHQSSGGISSNLLRWSSSSSYQFWSERWRNLRSSVGQVIVARMMRIVPGYGIAGIGNTELLAQWHRYMVQPLLLVDQQQQQPHQLGYHHRRQYSHPNNHDHLPEQVPVGCTKNDSHTTTAVWDPQHHAQRC